MENNQSISGIFSDLLAKVAHWFLYIFIAPDAALPKPIMDKRKRQIAWLQRIDKLNTYYNFQQLVNIINQGIIKRYGMRPALVLQQMYDASIKTIGAADPEERIENLEVVNAETGQKTNLWADIARVIEWLVELFQKLGIKTSKDSWTNATPTSGDWQNMELDNYNKSAGVGAAIPFLVVGVAAYYLFKKQR